MKILLCILTLAVVSGCASDRFYVGEAEQWWASQMGPTSKRLSIARADAGISEDRELEDSVRSLSVSEAEKNFSDSMSDTAYQWSIAKAEKNMSSSENSWQEIAKRFSVAQAEKDFAERASRR